MSKRIRISLSAQEKHITDWSKCFICQEDKNKTLKFPLPKTDSTKTGYRTLSSNISEFAKINEMPVPIVIQRIDEGDGIEASLIKHNAKYHESCRLKFNNTKLQRAQKRCQARDDNRPIQPLTRFTRQRLNTRAEEQPQCIEECFICEKPSSPSELHKAMTMKINTRIHQCATNLQDTSLLAKLSAGDVVAQEFKYHGGCLKALYNKERAHLLSRKKLHLEHGNEQEGEINQIIFAELVTHIIETQRGSSGGVVFKLVDLWNLYEERLKQFEAKSTLNRTRLKKKLLSSIPELKDFYKGREILLVYEKDVGPALISSCDYTDAMHLAKASEIVRKEILSAQKRFDGHFDKDSMEESVPRCLLQLVSMIEHGPDIKSQIENRPVKSDFALAQLLYFNCHKKGTKAINEHSRHSTDREPPFPIYVGLLLYAKTRKRQLIDTLFQHGICISYDRVLEISTQLSESVINQCEEDGIVCPSVLQKGLFTTSAVDNIDHNPSATTAITSFHGTGLSVFQHPDSLPLMGCRKIEFNAQKPKSKSIRSLPENYTNIKPGYLKSKPNPPNTTTPASMSDHDYLFQSIRLEYEWLQYVSSTEEVKKVEPVSWSAYHSLKDRGPDVNISISSLLPLWQEQAHSVATIKHAMDKVKEITSFLNPGQSPVMACDQPLFVLAKQIQWEWPELYGEDKFVVMFGGLHIEMAAFKLIGDLLKGTGWTTALIEANIASNGTAESFLTASNLTKTRQAHQITACCLFGLIRKSYQSATGKINQDNIVLDDIFSWCSNQEEKIPQFKFWTMILNLELLVLSFVRSIRESDFRLYKESLSSLIPYFFALDHTNYARWLPVHLRDMLALQSKHPNVYKEFEKGYFTVRKTDHKFSNISLDQAHEQNNAIVKGDGGAVGLTEDPGALRRWMVAGPEISRLISEFNTVQGSSKERVRKHHEETHATQKDFHARVNRLKVAITEIGNPFDEESPDLYSLDSKNVVEAEHAENILNIEAKGIEQYKGFLLRLRDGEEKLSFYEPLKRNKFQLFNVRQKHDSSKTKTEHLKSDCNLFSRLFISCQSRQCDLIEFFKHENQKCPPSLSHNGMLNLGVKSQLNLILEDGVEMPETAPNVDALIIDGASLVHSKQPGSSQTFDDYANYIILPHIYHVAQNHFRVDVVFDVYYDDSLKTDTRKKRGKGYRRKVVWNTKPPKSWNTFLRCDENKTELFCFLADKISSINTNAVVIVTKEKTVVCNKNVDIDFITPCTHEEADTRMFLHAKHAAISGCKSVNIVSSDTDVVVIGVSLFDDLGLEELWITFGKGKDMKWLPIHTIVDKLGLRSKALPFFHAFTGCDTVSAFVGKGKKTAWQAWNVYNNATETFCSLSKPCNTLTEQDIDVIENFVVIMYDRTSIFTKVNESRLDLFARKQRSYNNIPPSRAALVEHIKRSILQAGYIWGQSLCKVQKLPLPSSWGWKKIDAVWMPHWTSEAPIAASCQELVKCGCRMNCFGNCKCFKSGLPCSALCSCNCSED